VTHRAVFINGLNLKTIPARARSFHHFHRHLDRHPYLLEDSPRSHKRYGDRSIAMLRCSHRRRPRERVGRVECLRSTIYPPPCQGVHQRLRRSARISTLPLRIASHDGCDILRRFAAHARPTITPRSAPRSRRGHHVARKARVSSSPGIASPNRAAFTPPTVLSYSQRTLITSADAPPATALAMYERDYHPAADAPTSSRQISLHRAVRQIPTPTRSSDR